MRDILLESNAKVIQRIRRICVLERILNGSLKGRLIPTVVFLVSGIQFCSGSVLLMPGRLGMLKGSFFLLMFLEVSTFNLVVLTVGAKIFIKSGRFFVGFKEKIKSKVDKRVILALRPLRIEFGSSFIDNFTPLVVQGSVMSQMVSFVIASRRVHFG